MTMLEDGGAYKLHICSTFPTSLPTAQPTSSDALPPTDMFTNYTRSTALDSLQALLQPTLHIYTQGLLPHSYLHVALCHVHRGVHKPLVADAEESWVLAGCAKAVIGGVEDVPPEAPG